MSDSAWKMLDAFANGRGNILVLKREAKTKEKLKNKLQDFFGHKNPHLKEEDPFYVDKDAAGKKIYIAKINLFAQPADA